VQRAYCQNCGITTRDKNFVIFAAVDRVDKVLKNSNFGNMTPRCRQCGDSANGQEERKI